MDVTIKDNSWASQQEQARIYEDVLGACLENPGVCTAFLTWGFSDKFTWLGTAKAPLPYDQWYKPKPAYNSMLSLLNKTEAGSNPNNGGGSSNNNGGNTNNSGNNNSGNNNDNHDNDNNDNNNGGNNNNNNGGN
jgi:hypothetical protein